MGCDLHLINFSWRPARHLREDEPSNNNNNCTCTREASSQNRCQIFLLRPALFRCLGKKVHLQEASLDTPFMGRRGICPVDHKGRTEAEHDADKIGRSEGPGGSLRTQALLGNFGRVGVANCRSAARRECSQTGEKYLEA